MTSRWARVVRGGAIAAFATFVAALSHTLGGGAAPGALAIGLSFAFSLLLCIAVVGARLSAVRTVVAVSVTQFALHALYSVQGGPAGAVSGAAGPDGAASTPAGPHAHHLTFELPLGAASASAVSSPFAYDVSMLVTHLAAVVVTVLAIRHGDAALRAALGAALLAMASVVRAAPVLEIESRRPVPAASTFAAPRSLASLLFRSSMRRRGPPQGFAVA